MLRLDGNAVGAAVGWSETGTGSVLEVLTKQFFRLHRN